MRSATSSTITASPTRQSAFLYNYKQPAGFGVPRKCAGIISSTPRSHEFMVSRTISILNLNEHFQVNAAARLDPCALRTVRYNHQWKHPRSADLRKLPRQSWRICRRAYAGACGGTSDRLITRIRVPFFAKCPCSTRPTTPPLSAREFLTGMTSTGEYALSSSLLLHVEDLTWALAGTQFLQPAYATLDVRAQWTHPSKKYYVAVFGAQRHQRSLPEPGPVRRLRHRRGVERACGLGC